MSHGDENKYLTQFNVATLKRRGLLKGCVYRKFGGYFIILGNEERKMVFKTTLSGGGYLRKYCSRDVVGWSYFWNLVINLGSNSIQRQRNLPLQA